MADGIESVEDLEDALNAEIGEAQGYIQVVYRQWCIANAELVLSVESETAGGTDELIRKVLPTVCDTFEEFFADPTHKDVKDEDQSRIFREAGNGFYSAKKFKEAVKSYTKAAQYAPNESESLALAFANRSAVLFQQKKYSSAVADIARALDGGKYPAKSRHKLLERRLRCCLQLGQMSTWEADMAEFMKALEATELTSAKKHVVLQDLQKVIDATVKKRMKNPSLKTDESRDPEKNGISGLLKVGQPNPNFPSFASCVQVKYSSTFGRYCVAKRDIRAGELILSEDPGLFALNLKSRGKYCSNCFEGCADCFLPSPLGTKDVFCGETCRKEALESFHGVEGKITKYLIDSGMQRGEWFIGLRAITNKPLSFFTKTSRKIFQKHDPKYGSELEKREGAVYDSKSYESLFNLANNSGTWDGPNNLIKVFCVCFLLRCLKEADYFRETTDLDADSFLIARLLNHFMEIATMNAHEVGRFEWPADLTESTALAGGGVVPVGGCVEPTLDLLNHSCDNNVFRINRGRASMLFAARDIKTDEEITDNYLEPGLSMPMYDRQDMLKLKYHFQCSCQACFDRWPVNSSFPKSLNDVPPEQFRFALDDVRTMQMNFARIQKLGSSVAVEQKSGRYKDCLARCLEFVRVLEETVDRPHQFYVMTAKTMLAALWLLHGSRGEVA